MTWIMSCLCKQEKRKTLSISPPTHLLEKNNGIVSSDGHDFRAKTFRKPRVCQLCHQMIFKEGSRCKVCRFVCHKACQPKEAADRFSDTSWQIHRQWQSQPEEKNLSFVEERNGDVERDFGNYAVPILQQEKRMPGPNKRTIEIRTIQTTLERKPKINGSRTENVVLHTREDPDRNGTAKMTKMMTTSSSFNGISDVVLTTQPKSSKTLNAAMDLSYVTERIIALWFPSSCGPRTFHEGQTQASHMLVNKYGENYTVFNLSEPKRTLQSEHKHVQEFGWSQRLAPPLERICSVCKEIDNWLSYDQHRIAVIHTRGSKDRLGVIVAAYMHYSNICGSAQQALDRFSMRRFLDDNIGPFNLPSNKRYVEYFAGLLSHKIKINSAPLYLTHVTVLGAPSFQNGGCKAFLKIYEGQTHIYTSGVYSVSSGVGQFTVNVAGERRRGLELRGDILVKCYHLSGLDRETIFACQFHTCAVADYTLSFTRQELDGASCDSRFPVDGAVELHFSPGPDRRHPGPAPTPAVPVDMSVSRITAHDSPFEMEDSEDDEECDSDEVNHTFGPLDGSIYATIAKKTELSPGAVSSPLTVSMDSGISSAGHQQIANTTAYASPPLTSQASPLSPEDQHRELDELLSDMMLTVQGIPDVKHTSDSSVRFIDDDDDHNDHRNNDDEDDHEEDLSGGIPYHARQDSRPFTYGVDPEMIGDAKKLSSPSLVRKASFNRSRGDTLNKVQTQVFPSHERDPIDDIFTNAALNSYKKVELKRSYTDTALRPDTISTTNYYSGPFSDPETLSPSGHNKTTRLYHDQHHDTYGNNLTWLQRQQLKLKERKETKLREERQPFESNLMNELRNIQSRTMRHTASHRFDGYTSDTTAFADEDEDFRIPLHINVNRNASSPTSATSYSTIRSAQSANRRIERPFVAVKRTHELQKNPETVRSPTIRSVDTVDSGLLSLVDNDAKIRHKNSYREDSYSTWRSNNTEIDSSYSQSLSSRPQTPAFPVARTPYSTTPTVQFDLPDRLPPKSPTTTRKDRPTSPSDFMGGSGEMFHSTIHNVSEGGHSPKSPSFNGSSSPTVYQGTNSRRSSFNSSANNESPHEVSPAHVQFVSDTSRFWYKPSITREDAISMLRDKPPGTFIVRNSNTFSGAFGMALKVAQAPANVQNKDELVRHFLVEPTSRGVRLKSLQNEPVFSSLSALVYQHSITPIALPCTLILPEVDIGPTEGVGNQTHLLLTQGAACNVSYLFTVDMESLTGPQAVKKSVHELFRLKNLPSAYTVHFKVNKQGITLTDNKRKLFFRKHYPINNISYCGVAPDDLLWNSTSEDDNFKAPSRIFGFVARKPASSVDNQCHLFAELEPEQPATAIVNFVNKVLSVGGIKSNMV